MDVDNVSKGDQFSVKAVDSSSPSPRLDDSGRLFVISGIFFASHATRLYHHSL